MLLHILRVYSFLLWSIIYGTDVTHFNYSDVKDIWDFASFLLSWIKQLGPFLYRFMCEHKFSFLLDKCPGVQLLSYIIVSRYFFFYLIAKLFFKVAFTFYIHISNVWVWDYRENCSCSFFSSSPALHVVIILYF